MTQDEIKAAALQLALQLNDKQLVDLARMLIRHLNDIGLIVGFEFEVNHK